MRNAECWKDTAMGHFLTLGWQRYRFSAFWLRSKCSICSYQLNIWYEVHRTSSILNWFLAGDEVSVACYGFVACRPCIAVPQGFWHTSPTTIHSQWNFTGKLFENSFSIQMLFFSSGRGVPLPPVPELDRSDHEREGASMTPPAVLSNPLVPEFATRMNPPPQQQPPPMQYNRHSKSAVPSSNNNLPQQGKNQSTSNIPTPVHITRWLRNSLYYSIGSVMVLPTLQ